MHRLARTSSAPSPSAVSSTVSPFLAPRPITERMERAIHGFLTGAANGDGQARFGGSLDEHGGGASVQARLGGDGGGATGHEYLLLEVGTFPTTFFNTRRYLSHWKRCIHPRRNCTYVTDRPSQQTSPWPPARTDQPRVSGQNRGAGGGRGLTTWPGRTRGTQNRRIVARPAGTAGAGSHQPAPVRGQRSESVIGSDRGITHGGDIGHGR